jgi:hypothetical protein
MATSKKLIDIAEQSSMVGIKLLENIEDDKFEEAKKFATEVVDIFTNKATFEVAIVALLLALSATVTTGERT